MDQLLLIVEDEPLLRAALVRGLEKLDGVRVVGASCVAEAVAVLDDDPPQFIISDIDLPDGTGLDLLSVLDSRSLAIPIVFSSAYVAKYRDRIPTRSTITIREKPVPLNELRRLVSSEFESSGGTTDLAPFAVSDYMQLACMCRKTAEIVVHKGSKEVGYIVIREGELWGAKKGRLHGEKALQAILFASELTARCIGLRHTKMKRTINKGWESVLLESARLHDEGETDFGDQVEDSWEDIFVDSVEERRSVEVPKAVSPPPPETKKVELDYERRARLLSDYETAEKRKGATAPRSSPVYSPGSSNYIQARFDELYESGVDALLGRNYEVALRDFTEASELVSDDPRVIANLSRLREMGYGPGEVS